MKNIVCVILAMLLIACGGSYDATPRNSQLTVEYEGKKVYSTGGEWTSKFQLRLELDKPGKKFLVFGAPWCAPCTKLKKLLLKEGVTKNVFYLNVDETWAFLLSRSMGAEGLPSMVVVDGAEVSEPRHGMGNILVYLVANVEK